MSIRVGHGFDVHAFAVASDRPLVLGGVHFDGEPSLVGHSDADVVIHAVVDALLGASNNGDIGQHFSDNDPRWAGVDSGVFATRTIELLSTTGFRPRHIDVTIVTEHPNISQRRDVMIARLAELFGVTVNVKATRPESLGALGRCEGIACFAVATVEERS